MLCFGSVLMLSATVLLFMPYNQSTTRNPIANVEHTVLFDEIIAADQGSEIKPINNNYKDLFPMDISNLLNMLMIHAAITIVGMIAAAIIFKRSTSNHGLWSNEQHSPLNDQSSAGVSMKVMEEQCSQEQKSELVI